jgi:hypothetical protein
MSLPRRYFALTLLDGGDVLACGGAYSGPQTEYTGTRRRSRTLHVLCTAFWWSCERYVYANNSWIEFTSMPVDIYGLAMATLNRRPYVFGGATGNETTNSTSAVESVFGYDTTTNAWRARAHMPRALFDHTCVAVDGERALVCGGALADDGSAQTACNEYNATADVWTHSWPMNVARQGHGMCKYRSLLERAYICVCTCAQTECTCTAEKVCGARTTRVERRNRCLIQSKCLTRRTGGRCCRRACLPVTHTLPP